MSESDSTQSDMAPESPASRLDSQSSGLPSLDTATYARDVTDPEPESPDSIGSKEGPEEYAARVAEFERRFGAWQVREQARVEASTARPEEEHDAAEWESAPESERSSDSSEGSDSNNSTSGDDEASSGGSEDEVLSDASS